MLAILNNSSPTAELLLALAVVISAARVGGRVAERLGQPNVIGEIVVGILLGPTLLGALWPDAMGALFAEGARPGLNAIAQIGLVLFMFIAGLEVDLATVRRAGARTAAVTAGSVLLPLVAGALTGMVLHARFGGSVGPVPFAGFVGVAMAVTAGASGAGQDRPARGAQRHPPRNDRHDGRRFQ